MTTSQHYVYLNRKFVRTASDDPYGADWLIRDASKQGKAEFIRFLISCGANVNARSSADFRPVELALDDGHFEIAQILLDAGAEFAYHTFEHNSLLKAVCQQDLEKVRWLLERGFDPHVNSRFRIAILPSKTN